MALSPLRPNDSRVLLSGVRTTPESDDRVWDVTGMVVYGARSTAFPVTVRTYLGFDQCLYVTDLHGGINLMFVDALGGDDCKLHRDVLKQVAIERMIKATMIEKPADDELINLHIAQRRARGSRLPHVPIMPDAG